MPPLRTGIGSVLTARPARWAIQLGLLRLEAADLLRRVRRSRQITPHKRPRVPQSTRIVGRGRIRFRKPRRGLAVASGAAESCGLAGADSGASTRREVWRYRAFQLLGRFQHRAPARPGIRERPSLAGRAGNLQEGQLNHPTPRSAIWGLRCLFREWDLTLILFTLSLSPIGRKNIAQGASLGKGMNDRKAPERGGRTGPEHLTPFQG